jgi:hypothetical protein
MQSTYKISFILKFLLISQLCFADYQQSGSSTPSIFDIINFQEVVEVNLEMDLNKVIADRISQEAHAAKFSFIDKTGVLQKWDIKVSLRGKFRRAKCEEMPPLKLNFKKGDLREKGLSTFDDMKLVTHCIDDFEEAKKLVLKEYLAYKLYNQITEASFRVQLLKINYIDFNSNASKQQWAFLIEDTAQMRHRLNAEKVSSVFNIPREKFELNSLKKMSLFQYMIGNYDYEINAERNLKIVNVNDKFVPIPYDFDFSFFVNAPYATVEPHFQITSFYDRVYLGFEEDLDDMVYTKSLFKSKKKSMYKTVKRFKLLSRKQRDNILKYLDTFYDNVNEIRPSPSKVPINAEPERNKKESVLFER